MSSETLICHGGDLLEYRVASGYIHQTIQRISPLKLISWFSGAPKTLRILHKPSGTVLWHQDSAGPSQIVVGSPSEDDLTAQPSKTFAVQAEVSDPYGMYLPRIFKFTLGNTTPHTVKLYQSPLAVRFGVAGGIYGTVKFANGKVAAWALLTVTIVPSLGVPLKFIAQTNQHGEFRLALDRLPALGKDAPSATYQAKLQVRALADADPHSAIDPDSLAAVNVADSKNNGVSQFADFFNFEVTPGKSAKVVSPEHECIVLQT